MLGRRMDSWSVSQDSPRFLYKLFRAPGKVADRENRGTSRRSGGWKFGVQSRERPHDALPLPMGFALLLLCLSSVPALPQSPPLLRLTAAPADGQLYPREASGTAVAEVSGEVLAPGYASVELSILRDGHPWWTGSQGLSYPPGGGGAPFTFQPRIEARLSHYDFVLSLRIGSLLREVGRRSGILCGDAILVQGGGNALAPDWYFQKRADNEQSPWVVSFGSSSRSPEVVQADLAWHPAEGLSAYGPGFVGAWALRMANRLSEGTGVPIAVLNGAAAGTVIAQHLRDDTDPENLDTAYGRLLFRARRAGLDGKARALIWYQGEADGKAADAWARNFRKLYQSWTGDFRHLEGIYVLQVRPGCGHPSLQLREVQRELPLALPKVRLMSTNALPRNDYCHYFYAGYKELGTRLARLLGRDLYGSPTVYGVEAPFVERASFTSPAHDEIVLVFRNPIDPLVWLPGAEQDFYLQAQDAHVVSGSAAGNTILLQLSGPTTSTSVSYNGHGGNRPGWMTNQLGVGALSFYALPIQ